MSETAGEQESKDARAESVERQLEGDAPPQEPPMNESGGSDPADGTDDVGESTTRSGEDIVDKDGKEAGREDTGTSGPTDRPTGTSTSATSAASTRERSRGQAFGIQQYAPSPAPDRGARGLHDGAS